MESFYGGRQGKPFDIAKTYDTTSDMEKDLANHQNLSQVGYGDFVLISGPNPLAKDYGDLYQRTYDGNKKISNLQGEKGASITGIHTFYRIDKNYPYTSEDKDDYDDWVENFGEIESKIVPGDYLWTCVSTTYEIESEEEEQKKTAVASTIYSIRYNGIKIYNEQYAWSQNGIDIPAESDWHNIDNNQIPRGDDINSVLWTRMQIEDIEGRRSIVQKQEFIKLIEEKRFFARSYGWSFPFLSSHYEKYDSSLPVDKYAWYHDEKIRYTVVEDDKEILIGQQEKHLSEVKETLKTAKIGDIVVFFDPNKLSKVDIYGEKYRDINNANDNVYLCDDPSMLTFEADSELNGLHSFLFIQTVKTYQTAVNTMVSTFSYDIMHFDAGITQLAENSPLRFSVANNTLTIQRLG